jgi:hypothetical protein
MQGRQTIGSKVYQRIANFAGQRGLAADCTLIAMAVAVALAARFIEPLTKHDTLLAAIARFLS